MIINPGLTWIPGIQKVFVVNDCQVYFTLSRNVEMIKYLKPVFPSFLFPNQTFCHLYHVIISKFCNGLMSSSQETWPGSVSGTRRLWSTWGPACRGPAAAWPPRPPPWAPPPPPPPAAPWPPPTLTTTQPPQGPGTETAGTYFIFSWLFIQGYY